MGAKELAKIPSPAMLDHTLKMPRIGSSTYIQYSRIAIQMLHYS